MMMIWMTREVTTSIRQLKRNKSSGSNTNAQTHSADMASRKNAGRMERNMSMKGDQLICDM